MSNLCEELLIIYIGHFFPIKVSKKCANNHFAKTATFLERQLLLTKLQIVGYSVIHLILMLHLEHIFLKKRASNILKIHSFCKSGFNHF